MEQLLEKVLFACKVVAIAIGWGIAGTTAVFFLFVLAPPIIGAVTMLVGIWLDLPSLIMSGGISLLSWCSYIWIGDRIWDAATTLLSALNPVRSGGLIDSIIQALIGKIRGVKGLPHISLHKHSNVCTVTAAWSAMVTFMCMAVGLLITGALLESIKWWALLVLSLLGIAVITQMMTGRTIFRHALRYEDEQLLTQLPRTLLIVSVIGFIIVGLLGVTGTSKMWNAAHTFGDNLGSQAQERAR